MTLENITPNTHNTAPQSSKIGSINVLRFIAAFAVLIYHYTFTFYHTDVPYVDIPILRHLFQYGYLGVDLFFIISGFVISLSAEGRSAYAFVKSRIGRLYPVFWVSAIITSLFLIFGGHLIYSDMSWSRFLANMTMMPELFNADKLDGTYWTLFIEMIFYIIIFFILLFKKFKDIEPFAIILSVLFLLTPVDIHSHMIWIPNFIAGIIFYKIYKQGLNNWRIFALINTFLASLIYAFQRIPFLSQGYNTDFNALSIGLYIILFYIIFLLISLNKIKITNNKYINTIGLLTFPIYLLHHQIARILFTYADIKNIPLYISFPFMIIFIIILSYYVHKIFERRGKVLLDKVFDKISSINLKHF